MVATMHVWARQQLQLLTLQHLEEMTAFASISAGVKVLLEISAKISFHLLVLTLSTSWVRSFCADCFRMCWNPERNLALQCTFYSEFPSNTFDLRSHSRRSKRHQPPQKHDSDAFWLHGWRHHPASGQRIRGKQRARSASECWIFPLF